MAFSIFRSSKELIKLLYSLTNCNSDADSTFTSREMYTELSDEVRFPRFLYRGHTAMPPRGCLQTWPTEAASVSGRDVPNWGGGGCGAVTLDRWKQGAPGQRGAMWHWGAQVAEELTRWEVICPHYSCQSRHLIREQRKKQKRTTVEGKGF